MRQLRGDDLPALRLFLADQRDVDGLRLRAAGVDDTHQNGGIAKESHIGFARSRSGEAARSGALRNNVSLYSAVRR
jgi:hypothetical protein